MNNSVDYTGAARGSAFADSGAAFADSGTQPRLSSQPRSGPPRQALAQWARDTTPENPWPLVKLSRNMQALVERVDPTWVEAQVVEYNQRPGNRMSFFVAKDLQEDASVQVKAFGPVIAAAGPGLVAGARVVMQVKPDYYLKNGSLGFQAKAIHPTGLGGLLERLERLKQNLSAEGLFDAKHKQTLPFLPRCIGLICGHQARAQADVVENVWRRWPLAEFKILEVAVQGERCPAEVSAAIAQLDSDPAVEVIVVTRGGGSVEDLLGFSDESVVRTAFAAQTPLVSAVGHEEDVPLLDFVADFRASTPTDAAKRIVPDFQQEIQLVSEGRRRLGAVVQTQVESGLQELDSIRSRPVMNSRMPV